MNCNYPAINDKLIKPDYSRYTFKIAETKKLRIGEEYDRMHEVEPFF